MYLHLLLALSVFVRQKYDTCNNSLQEPILKYMGYEFEAYLYIYIHSP